MARKPTAPRKARIAPPADESKHDRFVRIGTKRMEKLLHEIRLIGNLAAGNYEAYPEDIDRMHGAIDREVHIAFDRFAKAKRAAEPFRFEPPSEPSET